MRFSCIVFLCFLSWFSFAAEPRVVVNTGHTDRINTVGYAQDSDLLFSGSDDGNVCVWDSSNYKLVYLLHVSHHPIQKIAVNPQRSHVAVVEKRKVNAYRLSVWNWKTHEQIFSKELKELPLYFRYSPKGTYLVYSVTGWESLTFLDGNTGEQLSYLDEGFGIVSGFIISPSEKTIMTYSPSGNIQYWDIRNGYRKEKISTLSDISMLSFTNNLRYMVGTDNRRIYMIDLISGEPELSLPIDNIIHLDINHRSNDLACITRNKEEESTTLYHIDINGSIRIKKKYPLSQKHEYTALGFYMNTIYVARADGSIRSYDTMWGSRETFGKSNLVDIYNLGFTRDQLVLPTSKEILVFNSDFFTSTDEIELPSYLYLSRYTNPFDAPTKIERISERRFALWTYEGEESGKLALFDPVTGNIEKTYEEFQSPLLHLETNTSSSSILTLEKNGTCTLLDDKTLDPFFTYSAFGLQTVTFVDDYLIAGKSRSSGFQTSMIQINPDTGETVPISGNNVLTFDIEYDSGENRLYSLGLLQNGGSFSTVLKEHIGKNNEFSFTVFSYSGEDLGASILLDPENSSVYSTVGYEGIHVFSSSQQQTLLRQEQHIARELFFHQDYLYTLNSDSSITVWDTEQEERLFDLYIFKDSSWLAQLPTGHYYGSSGAQKHVGFYLDSIPYHGDTSQFRLKKQEEQKRNNFRFF